MWARRGEQAGGGAEAVAAHVVDALTHRGRAHPRGDTARLALRRAAAAAWVLVRSCAPVLAAGLAAAIPVISSTAKAVRAGWMPAGDDGIIATRGWDVLTPHTPLVGQYSEAGLVVHGQILHSPGPMLYWLIALPARYGSVASIAVTMCVVNVLAIVACVAIARRRGGLVLMGATAVAIALMSQSLPAEAMHDIWNPAAALFPFLFVLFAGWSLACGDIWLAPALALAASFVVQTHLMYAAPTAVVIAVAIAGALVVRIRARRAARRQALPLRPRRVWPWVLAALVVTAACWTAPAIDEIEHSPGNLTAIARTVEHRGGTLGTTIGWHALVRSLGVTPWWLRTPSSEWERKSDVHGRPSRLAVDSTIALLAALALAALIGAFTRRGDVLAASAIGLGLAVAIVVQVAGNPAAPLLAETIAYTLWWGSELGMWVWLIVAWSLWLVLVAIVGRARRAIEARRAGASPTGAAERGTAARLLTHAPAAALALVTLAAIAATARIGVVVARHEQVDSHVYDYRAIAALGAGIERLVPPGRTIHYRFGPLDAGTQPIEPAIRFLLVRHGDRVLAPGSLLRLGPYYELYHRPVQAVVYVLDGTRTQPHMRLAARMAVADPWGRRVVSAWVGAA